MSSVLVEAVPGTIVDRSVFVEAVPQRSEVSPPSSLLATARPGAVEAVRTSAIAISCCRWWPAFSNCNELSNSSIMEASNGAWFAVDHGCVDSCLAKASETCM